MAGRLERGEIRLYQFAPQDESRPVLVLTRGEAIHYLLRITVAPVTTLRRLLSRDLGKPDSVHAETQQ